MRVSVNWLREFIDFDMSPRELADKLEMTGTAVEAITEISPGFTKVVIGLIQRIEKHPQADKLVVCEVDAGQGKSLAIVCGAANIKTGDKVPVALDGAKLPGGVVIKKATVRGVVSEGMLASETELALGDDAAGIMILEEDTKVGMDLDEALGITDTVIEFEITPNRPDCLSMIGIAREVAAITGGKVRRPETKIKEDHIEANTQAKVEIKDTDLCPRYSARVINGLTVGASPYWMRSRLAKADIRPINNLVDITNYILLETGQPLHAFDRDLVAEATIIVRRATQLERMMTLDEVDRQLGQDMLVIADPKGAVALAGIMGGSTTEINGATTSCLLESAYFEPKGIFKTGFELDLRTEASIRFERGTDPEGTVYAADRAAYLMQELAGGKVAKGVVDVYPKKVKAARIDVTTARARAVIGADIDDKRMVSILKSLDIKTDSAGGGKIRISAPSFRPDLTREIDITEEIARVYGFENVPPTVPDSKGSADGLSPEQVAVRAARDTLAAAGLCECVSYGFVDPADIARLVLPDGDARTETIRLANPGTETQSVMRPTLLTGLLRAARFNASYGATDAQLFEIGRTFRDISRELPRETTRAAIVLTGGWEQDAWYRKRRPIDFYDIKGVVEVLVKGLGLLKTSINKTDDHLYHPGQRASLKAGDTIIGTFGLLHPVIVRNYELTGDVFAAELDLGKAAANMAREKRVEAPSRFPAVTRDVALLVSADTKVEEISSIIKKAGGRLLDDAYPFDLYTGKNIPKEKKSIAYRLTYQAPDRTLTVEEVETVHARVIDALKKNLQAEIR